MSDLGSSFNPQMGRIEAARASWRRLASSARRSLVLSARYKKWALLVLPLLLLIPLIAALAWFASKPNPLLKAQAGSRNQGLRSLLVTGSSKAKPAAGRRFEAAPPPAPSAYLPLPAPAIPPSQPAATDMPLPAQNMAGTVAPAPIRPTTATVPVTSARTPFSPIVYRAKHDKVFGGSCSGQLTLNSGGLVFNCPDDPHGSIQIAMGEIGAVDENGVRLLSGKKYHFSIQGMTKSGEEALFANWLHQVR